MSRRGDPRDVYRQSTLNKTEISRFATFLLTSGTMLAVLVDLAMRVQGGTLSGSESGALETALRYLRDAAPHHTSDEEDGLFPSLERAGDDVRSYLLDSNAINGGPSICTLW